MENKKQEQTNQNDLRAGSERGHDFPYEPALKNEESLSTEDEGDRTTLNGLFDALRQRLGPHGVEPAVEAHYRDFRAGDVRHSQADIGKARRLLGYTPTHRFTQGLDEAVPWYVASHHATIA